MTTTMLTLLQRQLYRKTSVVEVRLEGRSRQVADVSSLDIVTA
jgi:hypothetical protein